MKNSDRKLYDNCSQHNGPTESTLKRIVERFQSSGSVEDEQKSIVVEIVHNKIFIWLLKNLKCL